MAEALSWVVPDTDRRVIYEFARHRYAASHRAIRELKSTGRICRRVRVRSSKYLNNVVEQDHRRLKQRIGCG